MVDRMEPASVVSGLMADSYTLTTVPENLIRLACSKYGRAGQYHRSTLIARFGPDAKMPDVKVWLADCPKAGNYRDACGAVFVISDRGGG